MTRPSQAVLAVTSTVAARMFSSSVLPSEEALANRSVPSPTQMLPGSSVNALESMSPPKVFSEFGPAGVSSTSVLRPDLANWKFARVRAPSTMVVTPPSIWLPMRYSRYWTAMGAFPSKSGMSAAIWNISASWLASRVPPVLAIAPVRTLMLCVLASVLLRSVWPSYTLTELASSNALAPKIAFMRIATSPSRSDAWLMRTRPSPRLWWFGSVPAVQPKRALGLLAFSRTSSRIKVPPPPPMR